MARPKLKAAFRYEESLQVMLDITPLLDHGEYLIERYRVKITELLQSGWAHHAPWLRAVITNRRLILLPEGQDGTCSSIDISYGDINAVWNVGLGKRDGVVVCLNNGEKLHLLVDWNQGRRLLHDTRTAMALNPGFSPNYML